MSMIVSLTNKLIYPKKLTVNVFHQITRRLLTVSETAIALRPFLFSVHPDLFGKFPKEQAVNEESLKRLNEYISQLHSQRRVSPLKLTFYIRHQTTDEAPSEIETRHESGNFRAVEIVLATQNLRDAVRQVLSSCSLPLDYVDAALQVRDASSRLSQNDQLSETIKASILERFYGFNPHDQSRIHPRRTARDTLSNWLAKNVDRGRHKALQVAPIRQEISRLKDLIMKETGAIDIQWQCSWTLRSYHTALKGLLRICRQDASSIDIEGRTVVFGTDTGVCIQGHVILRHDEIADHWIVTLKSLYQYDAVLSKIPAAECYLSTLLGNIEIAHQPHQPVTMAQDYLHQLRKLTASIVEEKAQRGLYVPLIQTDVDGVQLVVECVTGSPVITHCGQILVPSACAAFLVIDFINKHAGEARRIQQEFERRQKAYISIIERCYGKLVLESLTRDVSVTDVQMESCCRRLLKLHEMSVLTADLTSCRLKVAQFYSVMSDGDVCVPWNFEDVA